MPTHTQFSRPGASGRRRLFPFVMLLGVLLAGCEDMPESLRNRMPGGAPARVQTFAAEPKATFAAARAALDQMGYRMTGGGPAEGRLTAISEVSAGDWPGSSHQFTLRAEFHPALEAPGTEVSVRMTEVIESDSTNHQGQGTETPLQDTPLVEAFFHGIQKNLGPTPAAPAGPPPARQG